MENRRALLQRELQTALLARRILIFYQPVVEFARDRVIRFEALPRWNSHRFGWIESDELITLAESLGLIPELDHQLLRQACRDALAWPEQLPVAVPVSSGHLRDPMFGSNILAILADTGLSPNQLQLEFTESAFGEPAEISQTLISQLRRNGVKIALQDFGTGYASLAQLLHFRFDRIKIDRRFVDRLGKDDDCAIIVRAIIRLANEFGISVAAQGIDSAEQLEILIADSCQEGQGTFFGRPASVIDVPVVLERIQVNRPVHQLKSLP
jgi:EAL domain-containing protein (putative c-di-GMP-specific phosphodiesterase class I)